MKKLIGVGSALVDTLAFVPDSFIANISGEKGGMLLLESAQEKSNLKKALPDELSQAPGGSAANTACGIAQLGNPAAMLCKVGTDEAGKFYRQGMADIGVSTTSFKVSDSVETGECISMITPDSQRTMRTDLGASATMELAEITVADFANCDLVHIEGYMLFNRDLMLHILKTAKDAGCEIGLDLAAPEVVQASLDILPNLLAEYVDIVYANEDEAAAFANSADEEQALQELAKLCKVAVVKIGKRGAMISHDGKVTKIDAQLVDAVDTTGAGDLWAAGFLYGYLNDWSMQRSGDLAAKVAAEVVQQVGATIPNNIWNELRKGI